VQANDKTGNGQIIQVIILMAVCEKEDFDYRSSEASFLRVSEYGLKEAK
jgi:hypothetical protein